MQNILQANIIFSHICIINDNISSIKQNEYLR